MAIDESVFGEKNLASQALQRDPESADTGRSEAQFKPADDVEHCVRHSFNRYCEGTVCTHGSVQKTVCRAHELYLARSGTFTFPSVPQCRDLDLFFALSSSFLFPTSFAPSFLLHFHCCSILAASILLLPPTLIVLLFLFFFSSASLLQLILFCFISPASFFLIPSFCFFPSLYLSGSFTFAFLFRFFCFSFICFPSSPFGQSSCLFLSLRV